MNSLIDFLGEKAGAATYLQRPRPPPPLSSQTGSKKESQLPYANIPLDSGNQKDFYPLYLRGSRNKAGE
jgi:hypothetical protein